MRTIYLIDGYNLIHALGLIRKRIEPGGLEESRRQFLDFIVPAFSDDPGRVTVVFDAKQAPRGVSRQQQYRGLQIQFAPKGQSADDLIETLIAESTAPSALVVVSNDGRIKDAARRRGAQAWSDQDLLTFLEAKPVAAPPEPTDERRPGPNAEETKQWMKEFGSLADDPDLKENFDHNRFD